MLNHSVHKLELALGDLDNLLNQAGANFGLELLDSVSIVISHLPRISCNCE